MTERIIRRLAEITGLDSRLDSKGTDSVSMYPEKNDITERFCDGGMLSAADIRLRLKGTNPHMMFEKAESACASANASPEGDIVYITEVMPYLEECTEAGKYSVSCVIRAYWSEVDRDEDNI